MQCYFQRLALDTQHEMGWAALSPPFLVEYYGS